MAPERFVTDARDMVERCHVVKAEILGRLHEVPDSCLVDRHVKVGPAHTELDFLHGHSLVARLSFTSREGTDPGKPDLE
jgi:hypothetical protein